MPLLQIAFQKQYKCRSHTLQSSPQPPKFFFDSFCITGREEEKKNSTKEMAAAAAAATTKAAIMREACTRALPTCVYAFVRASCVCRYALARMYVCVRVRACVSLCLNRKCVARQRIRTRPFSPKELWTTICRAIDRPNQAMRHLLFPQLLRPEACCINEPENQD